MSHDTRHRLAPLPSLTCFARLSFLIGEVGVVIKALYLPVALTQIKQSSQGAVGMQSVLTQTWELHLTPKSPINSIRILTSCPVQIARPTTFTKRLMIRF